VYAEHNYSSTKLSVLVVYQNIVIKNLFVLRKIEKKFRKNSKVNFVLKSLCLDKNTENSIFKLCDIWNKIAKLQANILEVLTSTQALIANLSNQIF